MPFSVTYFWPFVRGTKVEQRIRACGQAPIRLFDHPDIALRVPFSIMGVQPSRINRSTTAKRILYKAPGKMITTTDISNVEKEIRDDLRKGTPRSQVEAYPDAKGIQHSYIDESKEAPAYNRTEMAMIRGVSQTWLVRGDIQILFKFDENGNLTGHSVRQINTGP